MFEPDDKVASYRHGFYGKVVKSVDPVKKTVKYTPTGWDGFDDIYLYERPIKPGHRTNHGVIESVAGEFNGQTLFKIAGRVGYVPLADLTRVFAPGDTVINVGPSGLSGTVSGKSGDQYVLTDGRAYKAEQLAPHVAPPSPLESWLKANGFKLESGWYERGSYRVDVLGGAYYVVSRDPEKALKILRILFDK